MTDIDQLIQLNVELEGLLRVVRDRDSIDARNMLADKIEEYTSAMNAYLNSDVEYMPQEDTWAMTDEPVQEADEPATMATVEVKDQEAEEPEIKPQAEAAEEAVTIETAHIAETNTKLLKAFTLNDRFRFRRELFGGDDADFSETLKLLADMESYSEACDYLYNDMMWNRTDPNVADFMAIVAANMPQ